MMPKPGLRGSKLVSWPCFQGLYRGSKAHFMPMQGHIQGSEGPCLGLPRGAEAPLSLSKHCALCTPTCVVHHDAQGGPVSVRRGGRPRHFSFLMGQKEHAKKGLIVHISYKSIVFLWLTTNMQIKVHNVALYRHTLW